MFDNSRNNLPIPAFLRFVVAIECCVVFTAAVLLFFLPGLAEKIWAWAIPPFNARFVGAIYFAAYIPLIIFWFASRWTPGRLILSMIFVFTALIMVVMLLHWDSFAWDRLSTFLVFWPLYFFLPVNSAVFLIRSREIGISNPTDMPSIWRIVLAVFALFGAGYGVGLLFAPEALTGFWPWNVDAFHARIYASAFVTPAAGAWILSSRRGAVSEYFMFGLNLLSGGLLPIIGTLMTNISVPVDRQIDFESPGTWVFFALFLLSAVLGTIQILLAFQKSKKMENR
jgi:hypothetical protein